MVAFGDFGRDTAVFYKTDNRNGNVAVLIFNMAILQFCQNNKNHEIFEYGILVSIIFSLFCIRFD